MNETLTIILGVISTAVLLTLCYATGFWNGLSFLLCWLPFWLLLSVAMLSEEQKGGEKQ